MQTLIKGPGSLSQLPVHLAGRALVISDQGLVRAGHVQRATSLWDDVAVYDGVSENPTESDVARCAEFAREINPDVIVALGGGSSLDTAKGILFLLSGGGVMSDYRGHQMGKGDMLPLIAVPTTAGTGSECQSYAIISRDDSHEKMACGDSRALAKVVILDSELTESMPLQVARLTALDALSHALESAVCRKRTPESYALSKQAFFKIKGALESVLTGRASSQQRGEMLEGAALAGQAIEASMLGAAHASANPLTANFNVVHGHAVMTTLPAVMRRNLEAVGEIYEELSPDLIAWVEGMRDLAGLKVPSIPQEKISQLAQEASEQWTGQFNPITMTKNDYVEIYQESFSRWA